LLELEAKGVVDPEARMNRGSWLLALGVSSLAAAFAAPGCSSSPYGGGTSDATSSSSSGADTGAQEAGGDAAGDADAASPERASMMCAFPGIAPIQACVNASCCTQWATCLGDPACIAITTCALDCSGISPGDAGDWIANQQCFAQCTADAGAAYGSTNAVSEFNAGNQCIQQFCTPGDGGSDGGDGGDGGSDGGDGGG